jgi:hypothetical protein
MFYLRRDDLPNLPIIRKKTIIPALRTSFLKCAVSQNGQSPSAGKGQRLSHSLALGLGIENQRAETNSA